MVSDNRTALKNQINSSQIYADEIGSIIRAHNYQPVPGSPINLDKVQHHHYEVEWRGELFEQSDVQAQMTLLAAIQNISLSTEDAGHRPAAFLALLRASMEASASANFLTSAAITSVAERARRGLNEMLYATFQQWFALDNYGEAAAAASKLATINTWLSKAAQYSDLGQITRSHEQSRPRAPYAGSQRPTISAMIDSLFPTGDSRRFGRWLYSALSAPAHHSAHGFAIAGAQALLPDGSQTINQEAELTHDRAARFMITGLSAVDTATRSVFTRYGWSSSNLQSMLEDAYSSWLSLVNQ